MLPCASTDAICFPDAAVICSTASSEPPGRGTAGTTELQGSDPGRRTYPVLDRRPLPVVRRSAGGTWPTSGWEHSARAARVPPPPRRADGPDFLQAIRDQGAGVVRGRPARPLAGCLRCRLPTGEVATVLRLEGPSAGRQLIKDAAESVNVGRTPAGLPSQSSGAIYSGVASPAGRWARLMCGRRPREPFAGISDAAPDL